MIESNCTKQLYVTFWILLSQADYENHYPETTVCLLFLNMFFSRKAFKFQYPWDKISDKFRQWLSLYLTVETITTFRPTLESNCIICNVLLLIYHSWIKLSWSFLWHTFCFKKTIISNKNVTTDIYFNWNIIDITWNIVYEGEA